MKFDMAHTRPSTVAKHQRKTRKAKKAKKPKKSAAATHSRNAALRELARRYPDKEEVGYFWKNPTSKTNRVRRWTRRDLEKFREFQKEYQKEKKETKETKTWWFF